MENEDNDGIKELTASSFPDLDRPESEYKNPTTFKKDHTPKTEVFHEEKKIFEIILDSTSKAQNSLGVCADSQSASVIIELVPIKNAYTKLRRKGLPIRYITEITKENVCYCKQLLEENLVSELRHLKEIKGNFGIIDKKIYMATSKLEEGKPITEFIYSDVKGFVEQQQYFFETLWSKAIDSRERIKEIEDGIIHENTEVIESVLQIKDVYLNLIRKSKEEILIIFPSPNAIYRQKRIGVVDLVKQKAIEGIKVKVLTPIIEDIGKILSITDIVSRQENNKDELKSDVQKQDFIRGIVQQQEIKFTVLIVDRKYVLTIELKDDSKLVFEDAVGLSTYSNSKLRVLSYVSIFENFWHQTELYEKLKGHDKMQKEFINIAAHELRTPTQSIIGYTQLAMTDHEYIEFDKKHGGFLEAINRNAIRLHKLTQDILDVARIESNTLKLRKEQFNLIEIISEIVQDIQNNNNNLNIHGPIIENKDGKENKDSITITADKERISQVFYNILDNAIKFTKSVEQGSILIAVRIIDELNSKNVVVQVKDTGNGIHKDIVQQLFTKFATKSDKGTGLGLYISKNIIQAHNGRIWAENNTDGKGATFSFSLPIQKSV